MKPEERQEKILRRLRALQKEWRVEEIARSLNVSPLTIRRDLDVLEQNGSILRTHGGCVYAGRMAMDSAYHQKVGHNFDLKEAIGMEAAREIHAGDAVFITDGSTCCHLASHLDENMKIHVYTNSLAMVPEILRAPNARLYIIGGEYHRELFCLGGSHLQTAMEKLTFDIVFLGTDAIDKAGICKVHDPETARLTKIMMSKGKRKILLADHTKLNESAHVAYASISDFDLWITTKGLPVSIKKKFSKLAAIREVRP